MLRRRRPMSVPKPLAAAILTVLFTGLAFGQPAFEVAPIKRAAGGGPPGDIPRNMDSSPGHRRTDEALLQALLTERLQMKVHREARDLAVYALVMGKGAPKLQEAAVDGEPSLSGGATAVRFHKFGLSRLTFLLTRRLDRPVLNLTGLEGIYDYTLDLSGLPTPANPNGDPSRASIFTAIHEDLGLKLEARKAPIQVLVIDQVNRIPAEN